MGIGGRGAGEKRKNTAESGDAQGVKRQKPDDADGAAEDELDLEIEAADADANELDDAVAAADEDLALDDTLAHDTLPPEPSSRGRAHWTRPAAPPLPSEPSSFSFQQLEIDYVVAKQHTVMTPHSQPQVPLLRMFGVSASGNSVCAHVHGFLPYFWAAVPPGLGPDDIETVKQILNDEACRAAKGPSASIGQLVLNVEYVTHKSTIWNYQKSGTQPFLRIVVALPTIVNACKSALERGLTIPSKGKQLIFPTYESNILFVLRFMIDCGIVGGNWVELPSGKYLERTSESKNPEMQKLSRCQYEMDVHYTDLISHAPEGKWKMIAPLRIMSIDIECSGRKGRFPEADKDPVIQIATYITIQGQDEPIIKNVMTLKTCSPIAGVEVMSFDDERDLLLAWRDLLLETDPDVVIGYNHCQFDMPYLINRAEALNLQSFFFWGRIKNSKLRMRDSTFSSRAYGTRESKEIAIEGRLQFDLLTAVQRDHKLSSYSLNSVSSNFLGEQKEDVHHSQIYDLQWENGNDQTRRRLAIYCLKDAYLPQRLLDKLKFLYNYLEMARVTGVPFSFLLSRGQSIKVMSQLLRKAQQRNMLIPNVQRQQQSQSDSQGVAYEGASVLDAKVGYYESPVATLDFASLYPSVMMAHNICYCTLVPKDQAERMNADDIVKSPTGDHFVKMHIRQGILPEILTELLNARKSAKADLKTAEDPIDKAVLNGRQLALKVSANSVYGFTGAVVGQLPCLEISSTVTAYGREMIKHTYNMVVQRFNEENGYPANAEVIYGDTDSVMIDFKVTSLDRCIELGEEAASYVSATFTKPIKLEFEKCYWPYLLINKKRYAGLLWTGRETYDKMDTKGIETVRRDNCLLVRKLIETSLHKILVECDQKGAIEYVKSMISDLLMNRLDLSLLVVTKALTRETENFTKTKEAHVELAKRMQQRDPASAPHVGDRIPYVIVKSTKGARNWEKSEDPIYALENNIPIDAQYYLEHHIQKPLSRIFDPILKNAERELFSGEHTRSISQPTPTSGGIMKFAKVKASCLGCRAPIEDSKSNKALCKHCVSKEGELYHKSLMKVADLETQFTRLWSQCQRCQGSLHQDILCSCKDCPIFYRRMKVKKDLGEAQKMLSRFDEW